MEVRRDVELASDASVFTIAEAPRQWLRRCNISSIRVGAERTIPQTSRVGRIGEQDDRSDYQQQIGTPPSEVAL
jgi:hypothetical protein